MQLAIHRSNIRVSENQLEEIERRFKFALDPFEHWVKDITAHLEDVNGSKGGIDKECRVLVGLRSGKTVKIQDIDADIVTAASRAADRLNNAISREVDRKREH